MPLTFATASKSDVLAPTTNSLASMLYDEFLPAFKSGAEIIHVDARCERDDVGKIVKLGGFAWTDFSDEIRAKAMQSESGKVGMARIMASAVFQTNGYRVHVVSKGSGQPDSGTFALYRVNKRDSK